MASRARRRPRVVWLPVDRNNRAGSNPATSGTDSSLWVGNLTVGGGVIAAEVFPVVGDAPTNLALSGSSVGPTLSDIEDSGYRLRRIVGKLFVGFDQIDSGPTEVIVTAGFIILRCGPDGAPLAAPGFANGGFYDPANIDNQADPWIWRRSWALSNGNADPNIRTAPWPGANTQYGSVADGAHIDQKTARVVGPEERLCLAVKAIATIDSADQTQGFVELIGDFRVLASMRTSVGNRGNSSR